MHDDDITALDLSRRSQGTFEFLDSRVDIAVEPQGKHWSWVLSIDGRHVGRSALASWSRHRAFEDASIAARDRIRTSRNPSWRTASGLGGL